MFEKWKARDEQPKCKDFVPKKPPSTWLYSKDEIEKKVQILICCHNEECRNWNMYECVVGKEGLKIEQQKV